MSVFTDKTVIVTGASQGLGREIAAVFAESGARVIVNCAHNISKAEAVAEELRNQGFNAEAYQCDVSDEAAVRKMFADLGAVDVLINNARLDPYFRKAEMSEKEWFMKTMEVNVLGAYLMSMVFMEQARARKFGRIVNISSSRAYTPAEPHMVAYNISKLSLHALSRSFADQGAPYGITANTVAPGFVETENVSKRLSPEVRDREVGKIPLQRTGSMREIAEAVFFAAANGYITGEVININGGQFYTP
jgi:3-oxoacyl-[acyl-carrier protein] reductase